MSSRLNHCLLLSFIAIALVQPSYSVALRARSTQITTAKTSVNAALQDIQQAQAALENDNDPAQYICLTGGDSSYASYGKAIGQLGTSDFTISLWIKTTENTMRIFDLIGNRVPNGHGNFFQIYMYGTYPNIAAGTVSVEIDEAKTAAGYGTNFGNLRSQPGLNDGKWHFLSVVRKGTSLYLYVDGALSSTATTAAPANILGLYDFKLGRSLDPTLGGSYSAAVCYAGPRVLRRAFTAQEVLAKYTAGLP